MGKFVDLTGQTFDRLKVIKRVPKPNSRKIDGVFWLCECSCESNNTTIVSSGELKSGNTKSCGCLRKEMVSDFNKLTKKRYITYNLLGEYGIGKTLKGEEFYFDLEDYNLIKDYCWHIGNRGYVICTIHLEDNKKHDILFHRIVTKCEEGYEVDHINGKKTRNDNRKYNLRVCVHQQNMCNYTKPKNNTSGVKGVSWDNRHSVWKAYITAKGDRINLGSYSNFDKAVSSRKEAEDIYHGEYKNK